MFINRVVTAYRSGLKSFDNSLQWATPCSCMMDDDVIFGVDPRANIACCKGAIDDDHASITEAKKISW